MAQPIVTSHATASNPFGSLGQSPGYNVQSIPMASSPFYYGMPNFTSQFSNSIPAGVPNASVGLGGSTPPYTPFSFGGCQISQMIPNMGGMLAFNAWCNPPTSGGNNQPVDKFGLSFVLQSYLLSADSNQYIWHDKSPSILLFSTWGRSVSHFGQYPTWI
jgi:hypothetical protein